MNDFITVYWSSSLRNPSPPDQWVLKDPEPVFNYFLNNNIAEDKSKSVFACPASRDFFKNLFVFKSNIDDRCDWPEGYLSDAVAKNLWELDSFGNKIQISRARESAISGYIDLIYSVSFVMFADEPLKMQLLSPSYPPSAPSKGAMFTSGEFDYGRWYRPALLNWFVPLDSTEFVVNNGDGLFCVRALTNKKIVFKKFMMNDDIRKISQEFMKTRETDGERLTLEERYAGAESRNMQADILEEIKKNLID
jgi:hypothetical protein